GHDALVGLGLREAASPQLLPAIFEVLADLLDDLDLAGGVDRRSRQPPPHLVAQVTQGHGRLPGSDIDGIPTYDAAMYACAVGGRRVTGQDGDQDRGIGMRCDRCSAWSSWPPSAAPPRCTGSSARAATATSSCRWAYARRRRATSSSCPPTGGWKTSSAST